MSVKRKGRAEERKKVVEDRIDITHRRFRVVGGRHKGECQAIAYLGRRKVTSASGGTVEGAVASITQALEAHIDLLAQERSGGIPGPSEYQEALFVLEEEVPGEIMEILIGHGRRSGGKSSVGDLARRSGREETEILAEYVRMGRRVGDLLDFKPETDGLDRSLAPLLAFAVVDVSPGGRAVSIELRSEMVSALHRP